MTKVTTNIVAGQTMASTAADRQQRLRDLADTNKTGIRGKGRKTRGVMAEGDGSGMYGAGEERKGRGME